ncbi:DUF2510 domain-containing protein [Lysobacter korlensis]|uniref:DUF2510 domain-containing protein n=1 Tax=Lysobacter korlensis TaxID=553636 RepID=A0ABV6RXX2_9GAMM
MTENANANSGAPGQGDAPVSTGIAAGWYDDGTGRTRWWDGTQWTEHYRSEHQAEATPVPAPQSGSDAQTAVLQNGQDATATAVIPPVATEATAAPARQASPLAAQPAAKSKRMVPLMALVLSSTGALVLGMLLGNVSAGGAGSRADVELAEMQSELASAATEIADYEQRLAEADARAAELEEAAAAREGEEQPAEEPATSAEDEAAVRQAFAYNAHGHLGDMEKDLDDLVVTLDENGFWRLLTNSVELSFNLGQLQALDVPAEVSENWSAQLGDIDAGITAISDLVAAERYADVYGAIDTLRAHVTAAHEIASSVE